MEPVNLNILRILEDFKNGRISAAEAAKTLEPDTGEVETSCAVIDISRESRTGFPEVIYAAGKTPQQVLEIFTNLASRNGKALATRCSQATLDILKSEVNDVCIDELSGMAWITSEIKIHAWAKVAIIAAGTSDLPVADEAAITLEFCGYNPERIYDVGVAGIHRLLNRTRKFSDADVIIVIAGMEGALPSVVGGLTGCPVIAVPTSVGYGANFSGLAPLLGMLNSCAAGITVVNIDNGFGAAVAAHRILRGHKP